MKSSHDPRHIRRIKEMQAIFAWASGSTEPNTVNTGKIVSHITEIDALIAAHAPKWPLDKINKVDLAVLRCAVWEIKYQATTPVKVIIDESVEIAKEYGTDNSSSFVNGVLGGIINNNHESAA